MRRKSSLVIFAGLVVLATVAEAEQPTKEIQREMVEVDNQQAQQNASLSANQHGVLETELKKAEERAQLAEKNADLAEKKLVSLEAALAEKDDQLEIELKKAQEKAQLAEKMADFANSQRSALETELKKMQERAQLAEKKAGLADPDARPRAETLASTQPLDSSMESASMRSTPQEIQADKGIRASVEDQYPRQLVLEYSRTADSGDNAKLNRVNPEGSASEVTSGEATSVEDRRTVISPQESSFPRMQTPDLTQSPVSAPASKISRPNAQANASPEPSKHGQDLVRVIAPKIHKIKQRSSARLRFVDVKARLIELWHKSLARSQQSRNRTVFSNSNKGER